MLLEPAELNERLNRQNLRILDTRSKDDYANGHIPGAVRVDVPSWQELGKSRNGFQNAKAWGEKVGALGIDRNSQVVVYGTALPDAARIWWTLKYLGVKDVIMLNGGWDGWSKAKLPVDREVPTIASRQFTPQFDSDRLEEIDSFKEAVRTGKVKAIDTRSEAEYTGAEVRGKRGGHIPGSVHLEWKELLAADGRFKSRAELRELFEQRGIAPSDTVVCY